MTLNCLFLFMSYEVSIITLILAMIQVESGGRNYAVGDEGRSLGCLQLTASYVQDASEHANKDWVHKDAFNRRKAIDITLAYMDRYATKERLGREPTAQDIARIHNGGPNGWRKKSTLPYWEKIKTVLHEHHKIN